MPQSGDIFDGRYKITSALGKGGFASAYLAEDMQTNKEVVLKFPNVAQLGDPASYERFKREISIGKLLYHPDLANTISSSEGNPPYIVVNYIKGKSLSDVINEKKHFTVEEVVQLAANLLDVLQYCHEHGVCHRDIKPENLMLGSDGHLKIIDFGIASIEGAPRVTYRGFSGLMGTPEYMSPEQIKGERGGPQTDIYAVGCIIYELLSGNPPFSGDNPLTTMYQHMTSDVKPLTAIRKDVSPNLWAVIRHSLFRRKSQRYLHAKDMAYDLRHLENVDLSWIEKPNPPLSSVVTTKKSSWIFLIVFITAILILIILIILFKNKFI